MECRTSTFGRPWWGVRGCDSQHRRTTSTRPTRDDGSHKEERVSSLGYVWTYILTILHRDRLGYHNKDEEGRQHWSSLWTIEYRRIGLKVDHDDGELIVIIVTSFRY